MPPTSVPTASPGRKVSSWGCVNGPAGSARVSTRSNDDRSYAASPRARRPSSMGPWNDTTPHRVVSHARIDVLSL